MNYKNNKLVMDFSVTQNGKPLDPSKYTWDPKSRTFSTTEHSLTLDFSNWNNCIFKTGYNCTFKTGNNCTFKTGNNCTFKTGFGCIFKTGSHCIFNTEHYCTFDTEDYCTFDTGNNCTFNTGDYCTFDTLSDCVFHTYYGSTIKAGKNSVVIRRDIFEVIQLEEGKKIKLNYYGILGYLTEEELVVKDIIE